MAGTHEWGGVIIDAATQLLSQYDFSNGQRVIADNANIDCTLEVTRTENVIDGIIYIESSISYYDFSINVSHPEAIADAISEISNQMRDLSESLYNYTESFKLSPGFNFEILAANYERFQGTSAALGIFL